MGPAFPEIVWLALFPMSLAAGTVGLVRHLRATRHLAEPAASTPEEPELVTAGGTHAQP